jgi:hypothetical protein
MAREEVDGAPPQDVRVHHICAEYDATPKKLEDRGRKMIFVGYESGSKVYRAYDPIMKHVHVTRDMVFDEQAQWD